MAAASIAATGASAGGTVHVRRHRHQDGKIHPQRALPEARAHADVPRLARRRQPGPRAALHGRSPRWRRGRDGRLESDGEGCGDVGRRRRDFARRAARRRPHFHRAAEKGATAGQRREARQVAALRGVHGVRLGAARAHGRGRRGRRRRLCVHVRRRRPRALRGRRRDGARGGGGGVRGGGGADWRRGAAARRRRARLAAGIARDRGEGGPHPRGVGARAVHGAEAERRAAPRAADGAGGPRRAVERARAGGGGDRDEPRRGAGRRGGAAAAVAARLRAGDRAGGGGRRVRADAARGGDRRRRDDRRLGGGARRRVGGAR